MVGSHEFCNVQWCLVLGSIWVEALSSLRVYDFFIISCDTWCEIQRENAAGNVRSGNNLSVEMLGLLFVVQWFSILYMFLKAAKTIDVATGEDMWGPEATMQYSISGYFRDMISLENSSSPVWSSNDQKSGGVQILSRVDDFILEDYENTKCRPIQALLCSEQISKAAFSRESIGVLIKVCVLNFNNGICALTTLSSVSGSLPRPFQTRHA